MRGSVRLLPVPLSLSGCGRAGADAQSLVRLAAVSGEAATFTVGQGGLGVWATVINDSTDTYAVLHADLTYSGAGHGFSTRAWTLPPVITVVEPW
jgi:hypothetical protein